MPRSKKQIVISLLVSSLIAAAGVVWWQSFSATPALAQDCGYVDLCATGPGSYNPDTGQCEWGYWGTPSTCWDGSITCDGSCPEQPPQELQCGDCSYTDTCATGSGTCNTSTGQCEWSYWGNGHLTTCSDGSQTCGDCPTGQGGEACTDDRWCFNCPEGNYCKTEIRTCSDGTTYETNPTCTTLPADCVPEDDCQPGCQTGYHCESVARNCSEGLTTYRSSCVSDSGCTHTEDCSSCGPNETCIIDRTPCAADPTDFNSSSRCEPGPAGTCDYIYVPCEACNECGCGDAGYIEFAVEWIFTGGPQPGDLCQGSTCSSVAPYCPQCVPNEGSGCQSPANNCGQTNFGTTQCSGDCDAQTPPDVLDVGNYCESSPNVCGQINSGTIECSGLCSAGPPPDSQCAPGNFTLNAPAASCTASDVSQIALSWTPADRATNYKVYRNGSFYKDVGTATSYTDTAVSSGTSYAYFVRASNANGSTDSNTQSKTAVFCTGDIAVNATLDGAAWSGKLKYQIFGPTTITNNNSPNLPTTHTNQKTGVWTMTYQSGGPGDGDFSNVSPSQSQPLPQNQTTKPVITYNLNFISRGPHVDLKANGQDALTIAYNTSATLSWTSERTSGKCDASGDWSGKKDLNGSESTGNLTSTKTYTLKCTGPGGQDTDSVTVSVKPPVPSSPSLALSATDVCAEIDLKLTDLSTNETGFRIYRNQSGGTNLAAYTLIKTIASTSVGSTGTVYSYNDTAVSVGQVYYYAATAYGAGGESAITDGSTRLGPVFNDGCAPNLSSSTKRTSDMLVAGSAYTGQAIKNGDTINFSIVIRNSGNATAQNISVSDTLSANLSYQGNARLKKGSSPSQSVSGSQNGQTITFSGLGDKQPDSQDGITWILSFDARVQTRTSQAVEFAQNSASITYTGGSAAASTGLFPVRTGRARVPDIKEIAP